MNWNPSPPNEADTASSSEELPELTSKDASHGEFDDKIGDTVFSKIWVLSLLKRTLDTITSLGNNDVAIDTVAMDTVIVNGRVLDSEAGSKVKCNTCCHDEDGDGVKLADRGEECVSIKSSPNLVVNCDGGSGGGCNGGGSPLDRTRNEGAEREGDHSHDLEEELCILWDASMNSDVAEFLHSNTSIDLLLGVVDRSPSQRIKEICVGIVGNMACVPHICMGGLCHKDMRLKVSVLLESGDSRVLTETIRLLITCLSHEDTKVTWLDHMEEVSDMAEQSLIFILRSSTSDDLLQVTASLMDHILGSSETLLKRWASEELVQALCEAMEQTVTSSPHISGSLLLSLQLLTTFEEGIKCLVSCKDRVIRTSLAFLRTLDHIHSSNYLQALAAACILDVIQDHTPHGVLATTDTETNEVIRKIHLEMSAMEGVVDGYDMGLVMNLKRIIRTLLENR